MLQTLVDHIPDIMVGVAGQGGHRGPHQAVHQLPPVLAVQGLDEVGPGLKVRIVLSGSAK